MPEWTQFIIETDDSGGHWKYPKKFYENQNIQRREINISNNATTNILAL